VSRGSRSCSRHAAGGFTLLELLIAVTVLSLMIGTLYSALQLGARSWEAGTRDADALDQMRTTHQFLQRYLAQAQPVAVNQGGRWTLHFEGGERSLRFVTEMPPHLGVGGLYEIWLGSAGRGDARRLAVLRRLWHPELAPEPGPGALDESTLVDELASVSFEYFGARGERAPPQWHTSWETRQSLPELVRARIVPREGDPWPALTVRPWLGAPRLFRGAMGPPEELPLELLEETTPTFLQSQGGS